MNIIWFNKFNMMPLMMPSWKNIAFSWFFRVFQALKGLAGVFDQHAARQSFWMWRPTLQTIFKHFKAHSRPKTMSYDVVRCHTMSTKRWECGPWKARFHQKRRQKRVAKCFLWEGKIWKNLSFEVVCCLLLWSSANPPPPTWWWVKGLVWTCRCLKGGVTSTREKSLVNPPVTRLT